MYLKNCKKLILITIITFSLSAKGSISPAKTPSIAANIECQKIWDEGEKYQLGLATEYGLCGIQRDKKKSLEFYKISAKRGNKLAQHKTGEMYFSGTTGKPDYVAAKKWFIKSAEQNYAPSQLRLGFLFAEGHFEGLKIDLKEAEKWFIKSAEQQIPDAQFRLGNFYRNYKKPPEKEKAIFWLEQAAKNNHRVAMFDLARMLKENNKNDDAIFWLKKAADLKLIPALLTLYETYSAQKNEKLAKKYLEQAAKTGSLRAKMILKKIKKDTK